MQGACDWNGFQGERLRPMDPYHMRVKLLGYASATAVAYLDKGAGS
jgi:hypothetical protein